MFTTPNGQTVEEIISLPNEEVDAGKDNMTNDDPMSFFIEEVRNIMGGKEIDWRDNFFDVGGDSLIAAELQDKLEKYDCWRSPQLKDTIEAATFSDLYGRVCRRNHPSQ